MLEFRQFSASSSSTKKFEIINFIKQKPTGAAQEKIPDSKLGTKSEFTWFFRNYFFWFFPNLVISNFPIVGNFRFLNLVYFNLAIVGNLKIPHFYLLFVNFPQFPYIPKLGITLFGYYKFPCWLIVSLVLFGILIYLRTIYIGIYTIMGNQTGL